MQTSLVTFAGLRLAFRRITRVIGNFQARVILTILYVVLILPVGLIVRLVSDPLRLRRDAPRPSVARGNAVNSMFMVTPVVCGLPSSPRWRGCRSSASRLPRWATTAQAGQRIGPLAGSRKL